MRILVTIIAGLVLAASAATGAPNHRWISPGSNRVQSDTAPRITPAELRELLRRRRAVVVDVRSVETYKSGHIKGALSIPIDEVETRIRELPRNKMIVTYCS